MGGCRVEDHLRRERVQVGPEPALEAPPEVREDHYRGVVRLEVVRLQDFPFELLSHGGQSLGRLFHETYERAPGEIHPHATEDPLLPIKRQMIDVFGDHDLGQEPCRRKPFSTAWAGKGAEVTPSWHLGQAYLGRTVFTTSN